MGSVPESINPEPKPFQFSLRTLLIVVTLFCLLLGLLVPAIRSAREAAKLEHWYNTFRQLSLGIQMYCCSHNRLPEANQFDSNNKAINSWRFHLVPYFERLPTYPPAAVFTLFSRTGRFGS